MNNETLITKIVCAIGMMLVNADCEVKEIGKAAGYLTAVLTHGELGQHFMFGMNGFTPDPLLTDMLKTAGLPHDELSMAIKEYFPEDMHVEVYPEDGCFTISYWDTTKKARVHMSREDWAVREEPEEAIALIVI